MKRFHVHVTVADLAESVRFYSRVFGSEPTVQKADYAKWMVDDPRLNFAISARGAAAGIDHLGLQVDSDDELRAMRAQLAAADASLLEEPGTHCCYAQSDKYWVTDPQGIAWETYHTLGEIPTFNSPGSGAACCAAPAAGQRGEAVQSPAVAQAAGAGCCSTAAQMAAEATTPGSARACCA